MRYEKFPKGMRIEAGEAVEMVKSGQHVALSPVCAEPYALVRALVEAKDRLKDVTIYTMGPIGEPAYARPEMAGHFKIKTFSVGKQLIEAVKAGRAEYVPCHLSQIPELFRDGILKVDVALIQLSPPDIHGYCSLGVSVSYIRPVLENAKMIIAQINEQMPRTMGDSLVHLSQIDYVVESSHPLPTVPPSKIGESEKRIGEYTSDLIPNGAVVQVGIGNIADAIVNELHGKKNLTFHSGTFSDSAIRLVESGVMDGKVGDSGVARLTATELIGSSELYKFCHNNPLIALRPIEYTHNFHILSRIKGLVSVTSGIQMDLSGQVNAEMLGQTIINGVGGQLDFVKGATASPGGKAVIVFPSTAKKGTISRIVAKLDAGISVAVGWADIDFVITEYGIATLRGKSISERAKELIAIAHPKFREKLKHAFNKIND